jgi:hypothetical protein
MDGSLCARYSIWTSDVDHINPEDETERLVVWSLSLSSWGLRPGLTRLVISTIKIDPYLVSIDGSWASLSQRIAPYRTDHLLPLTQA